MIEFNGLSEEVISPVISNVLSANMFGAIAEYRRITRKSGEETMLDMISLCENISTWLLEDEEFASRNMPERCCANCLGQCGSYREQIAAGVWDRERNCFRGSDCSSFAPVNTFMVESGTISLRDFDYDTNTIHVLSFQLEDGVLSITREKKNGRNESIISSSRRIVVIDREHARQQIIKHVRNGVFEIYRKGRVTNSLFVFGQSPNEGETYSEYFARAQAAYRSKQQELVGETYAMSYDEACAFIESKISGSELALFRSSVSAEDFLNKLYGGISVWERVEEIKREELESAR